jgi:tetratricopeptide (TPR) repeat protein
MRSVILIVLLVLGGAPPALAAGSDKPDNPAKSQARSAEYQEGVALVEAGEFEKARKAFEKAAHRRPRDPDVLNMLAYSQRKSGELDQAISNYKRALNIRPRFPQAREYLAEAYLQATLRELETLESYGKEAEPEHAQLVRALRSAVGDLPPAKPGAKSGKQAGW